MNTDIDCADSTCVAITKS